MQNAKGTLLYVFFAASDNLMKKKIILMIKSKKDNKS